MLPRLERNPEHSETEEYIVTGTLQRQGTLSAINREDITLETHPSTDYIFCTHEASSFAQDRTRSYLSMYDMDEFRNTLCKRIVKTTCTHYNFRHIFVLYVICVRGYTYFVLTYGAKLGIHTYNTLFLQSYFILFVCIIITTNQRNVNIDADYLNKTQEPDAQNLQHFLVHVFIQSNCAI